jgi:hypothetical protein
MPSPHALPSRPPLTPSLSQIDICFGLDILVNFNLAFENALGVLVTGHYKIARKYVGGFLIIDVLTVFPWQEFLDAYFFTNRNDASAEGRAAATRSARLLRLIRLFKLLRLLRAGRVFRHLKAEMGFLSSTWRWVTFGSISRHE